MKVILLRHVPKVGGPGEVVEVTAGYARNFLLAQGLAEIATPERAQSMADRTRRAAGRAEHKLRQAEKAAARLQSRTFRVSAKASPQGTLYAAISGQRISELLAQQGITLDKKYIQADHVKTLGEHRIPVELGSGHTSYILLVVTQEGERPR